MAYPEPHIDLDAENASAFTLSGSAIQEWDTEAASTLDPWTWGDTALGTGGPDRTADNADLNDLGSADWSSGDLIRAYTPNIYTHSQPLHIVFAIRPSNGGAGAGSVRVLIDPNQLNNAGGRVGFTAESGGNRKWMIDFTTGSGSFIGAVSTSGNVAWNTNTIVSALWNHNNSIMRLRVGHLSEQVQNTSFSSTNGIEMFRMGQAHNGVAASTFDLGRVVIFNEQLTDGEENEIAEELIADFNIGTSWAWPVASGSAPKAMAHYRRMHQRSIMNSRRRRHADRQIQHIFGSAM